MTTCLGKSCSFGLPRVPFYVFSYFPFGFEGRMWDLIVSVPDHCLSFYFGKFFYHRETLESSRTSAVATSPVLWTEPHGYMYVRVQTVLCEHLVPIN